MPADLASPSSPRTLAECSGNRECSGEERDDDWRRFFFQRFAHPQMGDPQNVFGASFILPKHRMFDAIDQFAVLVDGKPSTDFGFNSLAVDDGTTIEGSRYVNLYISRLARIDAPKEDPETPLVRIRFNFVRRDSDKNDG